MIIPYESLKKIHDTLQWIADQHTGGMIERRAREASIISNSAIMRENTIEEKLTDIIESLGFMHFTDLERDLARYPRTEHDDPQTS